MMKKIIILCTMLLLLVASYLFIPKTNVNYDMTLYLPNDSMTKEGLQILEDEFGSESMIEVMIVDILVDDLLVLKPLIYGVPYVTKVIWLDDYVDLDVVPVEFIDSSILSHFYTNNTALISISFSIDAYDVALETSIKQIKDIFDLYEIHLRGEALVNIESRTIAKGEIFNIMFFIVPIVILLLIISSHAWIEPVLILIPLGIAILFNLFTNGLLPHVSFITQTMSLALQLALSIDYALFMIHRYYEERESSGAVDSAKKALKHSIKPIATSALTTIAGFGALMLMKFTIGFDIAIVLSKGIVLSFLVTIIVLPVLLIWFDPLIQKTRHKMIIPPFVHMIRFEIKLRYVFITLFVALTVFGFIVQQKTDYLFGANSIGNDNSIVYQDREEINELFGPNEPLMILVPNETIDQEVLLAQDLLSLENVLYVSSLVTEVDPLIPRAFLPETLVSNYVGSSYTRFILKTNVHEENDELFEFIEAIKQTVANHYSEFYLIGQSSALVDIKSSTQNQGLWIMALTVLSVGLIVGLIFKSIKIPLLLVGVILSAIWFNLGLLSLMGIQVIYIGYLVVMSIQLGATIDYAVLLTHRYLEEGKVQEKKKAIETAFSKSSLSIIISGAILSIAGFVEGLFSQIDSVTKIGFLLGRGVLISLLSILIFLPVILYLCIKPKKSID